MDIRDRLTRFFRSRVSSAEDAEDLAQDVLLRAHNARAQLRDDERLESWLFSIARNALTDFYRRKARAVPPELQRLPEPHEEPETLAELARCVRPLLAKLNEADRGALEAVDLNGVSQVQLAESLGLSRSGAKSRVQRARRRLHEEFLKCCDIETDARGRPTDILARGCGC